MGKQLDEYKQQVRSVAIRVAKENGWCDDGLNKVLEELGLPEKQEFNVPVVVTTEIERYQLVEDATSWEEARAKVQAMEHIAPSSGTYVSHRVLDEPAEAGPTPCVGDWTHTLGSVWYRAQRRGSCGAREMDSRGYVCTRPPHMTGPHVAANPSYVVSVWGGVTEGLSSTS